MVNPASTAILDGEYKFSLGVVMVAQWYTLHVKPHRERAVYKLLRSPACLPNLAILEDPEQTYELFFPSFRVKPVNPRSAKVRPFFPGYLFVCFDLDAVGIHAFDRIPGTHGLVAFGGEPAPVPPNLIDSLKKRMAELAVTGAEAAKNFRRGERLRITDGPFAGYEALFDEHLPGTERVQVLLAFLNKTHVKLELDVDHVNEIDKRA